MTGGGVIVARSLWDDPVFQDDPFSEREAWIWMICEAAWKPRPKRIGKVIVNLERGQLAASVRFMAEAFSWHRNKVNRFLKRLEKCNSIRAESGTGVNVITICKYDEYQLSPKQSGTAAGQQRDSSGTNENKGNKVKEDTNVSLAKKRGNRLPDDWFLPKEWGEWAVSEGYEYDQIRVEADKFKDYWHSIAGAKGVKLDWQATWRNWMRNSSQQKGGRNGNGNYNGKGDTDATNKQIAFAARAIRTPSDDCF